MARINIEECWWSDPRRTALLLQIGFEADSAAVNLWRIAQEFWGKSRGLIPKSVFDKVKHSSALVEAGLADVRESFVYVRGCSEYLEWHAEKREQASAAGRKSAEVRRQRSGSAQPTGGKGHKKSEREPNEIRTEANGTEPSGSLSGSLSGFIEFYNTYPRREKKKAAEKKYHSLIESGLTHEKIMQGLANYLSDLSARKTLPEYFKLPTTWLNELPDNWIDEMPRPLAAIKSPSWSELATELYHWSRNERQTLDPWLFSLAEKIGIEKIKGLHRDDFRPAGSMPALLKQAAAMGAA